MNTYSITIYDKSLTIPPSHAQVTAADIKEARVKAQNYTLKHHLYGMLFIMEQA
jgi:hypothetical protein